MGIDPRGPRFGVLVTTVVLAAVLVTGSGWLLAAQALVFAAGAVLGLRYAPFGLLYRGLIRPRLGPPRELEPEAPPGSASGARCTCSSDVSGRAARRWRRPELTRRPTSEPI